MKVVLILLDAFRHDYISKINTPFLDSLINKSVYIKQIVPSYGFCERTEILTGLNSRESGFFTAIGYDPKGSEYSDVKFLRFAGFIEKILPESCIYKKHSLRSVYRRTVMKYLLRGNNFKMRCYEIPLSLLKYFNLTEDEKDHRDKDAFEDESIFDLLEQKGEQCFYDSFSALGFKEAGDDNNRLQIALNNANKDYKLYLIYNSKPDSLGHKYGVGSTELKKGLKTLDKDLSDFTEKFLDKEPNTKFIFLGDHGMTNVLKKFNVQEEIIRLAEIHGLKLHRDYIYFLDSTIARIWLMTHKSKTVFRDCLIRAERFLSHGTFVDEALASIHNIPFNDDRYGDLIWLANEGVLIKPDFFHRKHATPVGMHGYNPTHSDSRGFSLIFDNSQESNQVKNFDEKNLTCIYDILKKSFKEGLNDSL